MSHQVQSILEAVQRLAPAQRRELLAAIQEIESTVVAPLGDREAKIAAVSGKYRHVPTSSAAFMDRKHEDLELER